MSHTLKRLDKSQVEFLITVTPVDYQSYLEAAAIRLSERVAVGGFRRGKVPYDIMKRTVGDMAILEEALQAIIQATFYQAVTAEKLETIGMPKIAIEKVAPGNDVTYKATVGLLPDVTLPDFSQIHVARKDKPVEEKAIDETIEGLRGMQAKEIVKDGPAIGTDKLIIDMDMLLDNVPVDGGQAKNYQVYLSEEHYIPGFNTQLVGLKKDEEKKFQLSFPKEHYQKMLAGKKVDFVVNVKEVYERNLPEISDEFAKALGQDSVAALRDLVKNNLLEEAKRKNDQQYEVELLEAAMTAATFQPIPEVIIDAEKQKIFFELKRDIERHGLTMDQYLLDIKKKEDELFKDFADQAEKRAKAALLSRAIAKKENIVVSDTEIDAEIKMMSEMYKDNKENIEALQRPEVRDSIATMIQNKKVVAWIKEQVNA